MSEKELPADVLKALVENTKVIDSNTELLSSINEDKNKEEVLEKNLVKKNEITPNLSNDEKARYRNIGKELFSPVFLKIQEMLKRERKKDSMIIHRDKNTIKNAAKKNNIVAEKKEKSEFPWTTVILGLIATGAAAFVLFQDKIKSFFSNAWTNITEIFGSISNFFDFDNPDSPFSKILSTIVSTLDELWASLKSTFNEVTNKASEIWNSIKANWNAFIDGILSFGNKIIDSLKNFGSNAFESVKTAIVDSIIGPIKSIFSSSKDEGTEAGKEIAKDVKVAMNQKIADESAKAKAFTDNTLYRTDKVSEEIHKVAEINRTEAAKKAKEQGLTITDNKLSDESIKANAAGAAIEAFMKAHDIKEINDKEYETFKKIIEEKINISNDGSVSLQMEQVREAFMKKANELSDKSIWDSPFVDALQKSDPKVFNEEVNGVVADAFRKGLDIKAELNAANNLENMSEEDRFEARLRHAIETGKSAEFRFAEGRSLIKESTETIKKLFTSYDEKIRTGFTQTWSDFISKFADSFKVNVETKPSVDESHHEYKIMPLHKESFETMNDQLTKLAKESAETIHQQNKVLEEIKKILSTQPSTNKSVPIVQNIIQEKKETAKPNIVAEGARALSLSLYSSVA